MPSALVIDDSRATRKIIGKILIEAGFSVLEAEDGQKGLDRLAEHGAVDVATVDWNMPVMNGLEFIRAVRKESNYRDINLVMVTTESEQAQVVRALAAGAHDYLTKPFDKEGLLSRLRLLGLVP